MTEIRKYTANDNWGFTEYGFDIQVRPREAFFQPNLPPNVLVANIDRFSTASGKTFEDETVTDQTLLNLLFGFQAFFEKMSGPELQDKTPEFLWMRTLQRKMARLVKKLGFEIEERGDNLFCTGETTVVRAKVDEFFTTKKGVIDRLQRRVAPNK